MKAGQTQRQNDISENLNVYDKKENERLNKMHNEKDIILKTLLLKMQND